MEGESKGKGDLVMLAAVGVANKLLFGVQVSDVPFGELERAKLKKVTFELLGTIEGLVAFFRENGGTDQQIADTIRYIGEVFTEQDPFIKDYFWFHQAFRALMSLHICSLNAEYFPESQPFLESIKYRLLMGK